jgi:DNA-binding SARP family transcriptional activator
MFLARLAAPVPDSSGSERIDVQRLAASSPLILNTVHGDLHVARFAADLASAGRVPVWARLAPYDLDRPSLDRLARASLARPGAGRTAEPSVAVVESDDRGRAELLLRTISSTYPKGRTPAGIVLRYLPPEEERGITPPARPVPSAVAGADVVDGATRERLWQVTAGRPALFDNVLQATHLLASGDLADIARRSENHVELTRRLAGRLLTDLRPDTRAILGFVSLLGYCHERFASTEPVLTECADLPWWILLSGGWRQLEPVWREGIRAACASATQQHLPMLARLVAELMEDGATDEAVELCLDAGYPGMASDLMAEFTPDVVAADCPRTVARWLSRLPIGQRGRHDAIASATVDAAGPRRRWWPSWWHRATTRDDMLHPVPNRRSNSDRPPVAGDTAASAPALEARLFGPMDISVGGRRVEQWHGRKTRTILAYVLLNRAHAVPRDVLTTTFWPDASPDAARNRLHVTLHALRTDLRSVSPVPIVVFEQGYIVNPQLAVRLDVEAFEGAMSSGRRAEKDGDLDRALAAYRESLTRYGGDLLAGQSHDDWALLPREHLRMSMLDALERTAQIEFELGLYAECVDAGQHLLTLDFCREDVHRLLMRAYSRLDQLHLAMRQFQVCSRQLRLEFDMAPAPETIRLIERIRIREPV